MPHNSSPDGGSAAAWPAWATWPLDLGTLMAWLIGVALVALGSPSAGLAADFLSWSLLALGGSRRVWPQPVRGAAMLLMIGLAVWGGGAWMASLLRPR